MTSPAYFEIDSNIEWYGIADREMVQIDTNGLIFHKDFVKTTKREMWFDLEAEEALPHQKRAHVGPIVDVGLRRRTLHTDVTLVSGRQSIGAQIRELHKKIDKK